MTIFPESKTDAIAVLQFLKLAGYQWNWFDEDVDDANAVIESDWDEYPFIGIDLYDEDKEVSLHSDTDDYTLNLNWPQHATKIVDLVINNKIITVENVGDYSAVISREAIQVGCQTISFEKFQEIVDAISKFKN